MTFQPTLPVLLCFLLLAAEPWPLLAQNSAPSQFPSAPAAAAAAPHNSDAPDLLRETQLGLREVGHSGLVWWIPFEFWLDAGLKRGTAEAKTTHDLGALKDYTVVLTFAAQVSPLGSFTFVPPEELKKSIFVRDGAGNDYPIVAEPSQDAKTLATFIKPILSNALGKAGESCELLFFPARGKDGKMIADAISKGQFSVVFKSVLGVPESVYAWKTPLTSVSPPKYCPTGKELVHADWDYCPWHGTKLN